jgi:putative membrane protein
MRFVYPAPDNKLALKLKNGSIIISVAVLLLVGVMRRVKIDLGVDFSFLPPFHALFNTLVAVCLLAALYFVKQKDIINHRRAIFGAMTFSALFLICYVLYHFTTIETTYCKEGLLRTLYYILLISHIVLAGISLPFILLTFSRGFTFQVESHKKMARWVYPIWMYVAVTGPVCYLMLKPCYL